MNTILFAVALILSAFIPMASAEPIKIATGDVGSPPDQFEVARTGKGAPATWLIRADPDAEGGKAIEQTSADPTDYRFPLAIYKPFTGQDATVSVRFKAMSGKTDQAGGIAIRLTTPDDYYVVRANALEDNVRFYRVVKGRRDELRSANAKVARNQWHTLALKAKRNRFTVSFDGQVLYTVTDDTFQRAGKVALWTKADSVTRFDRLDIAAGP